MYRLALPIKDITRQINTAFKLVSSFNPAGPRTVELSFLIYAVNGPVWPIGTLYVSVGIVPGTNDVYINVCASLNQLPREQYLTVEVLEATPAGIAQTIGFTLGVAFARYAVFNGNRAIAAATPKGE